LEALKFLESKVMEMHQVRYFLAAARTLNFTRAAEDCNVSQPSLTRAIRQLEAELGGDLFRRERPAAQLTELGIRLHPHLEQCHAAAAGAKSLATAFRTGQVGTLRLAVAEAVDLSLLIPHFRQLKRLFNSLEFKIFRGSSEQIGEYLKNGDAELGIASKISKDWDRLDCWPLFTETFQLVVNGHHPLAAYDRIEFADLRQEQLLSRCYCEYADRLNESLRARDIDVDHSHAVSSERDLIALLEADLGIALIPYSASTPETLKCSPVVGLDVRRTVQLFGVAGRERTAVASAVMKLLRSADWLRFATPPAPTPKGERSAVLSIVAAR
jgi:DNA-binding transcriptional LysR family regulator